MPNTMKVTFQGKEFDATLVEANQASEYWNQYLLDDGSVLKLKTVATQIVRLVDEYDPEGNPIYVVRSGNIVTVTAPEHLKKKP
jgi:hypothetical protein